MQNINKFKRIIMRKLYKVIQIYDRFTFMKLKITYNDV